MGSFKSLVSIDVNNRRFEMISFSGSTEKKRENIVKPPFTGSGGNPGSVWPSRPCP